jgi:hypothetical protein
MIRIAKKVSTSGKVDYVLDNRCPLDCIESVEDGEQLVKAPEVEEDSVDAVRVL